MCEWLAIAMLVRSTIAEPSAETEPGAETEEDPPSPMSAADAQADALAELSRSHDLRGAGDATGAIEAASSAVALDPGLAAAWLARAQARIDLAGDEPTPADPTGVIWTTTLRAAADDLEQYLRLAAVQGPARTALEAERDRLRRRASEWTPPRSEPAPQPPPEPPTTPAIAPPDLPPTTDVRGRAPRGGTAMLSVGVFGTIVGVGLSAAGVRVRRTCASLCAVSWESRDTILAPAAIGTALGATLVPWGTARLIATHRPSPRVRRILGGTLLGAGGATLATGIALLAIATARWNDAVPSDGADLGRIQSMANGGIALLSSVPATAGAGLAALLGGRRRSSRVTARRGSATERAP